MSIQSNVKANMSSKHPSFDFRWEEECTLRGRVAHPTPVSVPGSKNGTLVWLMSDGTFTVRVLKDEYDGEIPVLPHSKPHFNPPAWEWRYCCSIHVLECCKCLPEEGNPLSLIYMDGAPLNPPKH